MTTVTGRRLPALNGLRGVAVIGVVAYHLQLRWASGGYLGVDLFFVLSVPPKNDPTAPKDAWIRVRKLDNVHLCPEGSARYADALLADMTSVFRLPPAAGDWSQGAWVTAPGSTTRPERARDHPSS